MIYGYRCPEHGEFDVIKSHTEYDKPEFCPDCGLEMKRGIYAPSGISVGTFKEGHYHAFGKTFTNKHQLSNELRRIKGETGKELVEVGNDKSVEQKKRRRFNKQEKTEMARELNHILNGRAG